MVSALGKAIAAKTSAGAQQTYGKATIGGTTTATPTPTGGGGGGGGATTTTAAPTPTVAPTSTLTKTTIPKFVQEARERAGLTAVPTATEVATGVPTRATTTTPSVTEVAQQLGVTPTSFTAKWKAAQMAAGVISPITTPTTGTKAGTTTTQTAEDVKSVITKMAQQYAVTPESFTARWKTAQALGGKVEIPTPTKEELITKETKEPIMVGVTPPTTIIPELSLRKIGTKAEETLGMSIAPEKMTEEEKAKVYYATGAPVLGLKLPQGKTTEEAEAIIVNKVTGMVTKKPDEIIETVVRKKPTMVTKPSEEELYGTSFAGGISIATEKVIPVDIQSIATRIASYNREANLVRTANIFQRDDNKINQLNLEREKLKTIISDRVKGYDPDLLLATTTGKMFEGAATTDINKIINELTYQKTQRAIRAEETYKKLIPTGQELDKITLDLNKRGEDLSKSDKELMTWRNEQLENIRTLKTDVDLTDYNAVSNLNKIIDDYNTQNEEKTADLVRRELEHNKAVREHDLKVNLLQSEMVEEYTPAKERSDALIKAQNELAAKQEAFNKRFFKEEKIYMEGIPGTTVAPQYTMVRKEPTFGEKYIEKGAGVVSLIPFIGEKWKSEIISGLPYESERAKLTEEQKKFYEQFYPTKPTHFSTTTGLEIPIKTDVTKVVETLKNINEGKLKITDENYQQIEKIIQESNIPLRTFQERGTTWEYPSLTTEGKIRETDIAMVGELQRKLAEYGEKRWGKQAATVLAYTAGMGAISQLAKSSVPVISSVARFAMSKPVAYIGGGLYGLSVAKRGTEAVKTGDLYKMGDIASELGGIALGAGFIRGAGVKGSVTEGKPYSRLANIVRGNIEFSPYGTDTSSKFWRWVGGRKSAYTPGLDYSGKTPYLEESTALLKRMKLVPGEIEAKVDRYGNVYESPVYKAETYPSRVTFKVDRYGNVYESPVLGLEYPAGQTKLFGGTVRTITDVKGQINTLTNSLENTDKRIIKLLQKIFPNKDVTTLSNEQIDTIMNSGAVNTKNRELFYSLINEKGIIKGELATEKSNLNILLSEKVSPKIFGFEPMYNQKGELIGYGPGIEQQLKPYTKTPEVPANQRVFGITGQPQIGTVKVYPETQTTLPGTTYQRELGGGKLAEIKTKEIPLAGRTEVGAIKVGDKIYDAYGNPLITPESQTVLTSSAREVMKPESDFYKQFLTNIEKLAAERAKVKVIPKPTTTEVKPTTDTGKLVQELLPPDEMVSLNVYRTGTPGKVLQTQVEKYDPFGLSGHRFGVDEWAGVTPTYRQVPGEMFTTKQGNVPVSLSKTLSAASVLGFMKLPEEYQKVQPVYGLTGITKPEYKLTTVEEQLQLTTPVTAYGRVQGVYPELGIGEAQISEQVPVGATQVIPEYGFVETLPVSREPIQPIMPVVTPFDLPSLMMPTGERRPYMTRGFRSWLVINPIRPIAEEWRARRMTPREQAQSAVSRMFMPPIQKMQGSKVKEIFR